MRNSIILLFVLFFTSNLFAQTYYVKTSANGGSDTNDGLSWATAMANPQTAINTAKTAGGGDVLIAAGTYNPTLTESGNTHVDSTRFYTFTMKNNVKVYGGFAGLDGETIETRAKSDIDSNGNIEAWEFTNTTILSGEIQNDTDSSNNSYRVVLFSESSDSTAILNGFSITDGFLKSNLPDHFKVFSTGINILNSGKVKNCIVTNCYSSIGGGIYSINSSISNCYVLKCSAKSFGGGIYGENSNLSDCHIDKCFSKDNGGGIYCKNTVISNSIIFSNTKINNAIRDNSIFCTNSSTKDCLISNCKAISTISCKGGGIYSYQSDINKCIIENCIAKSDDKAYSGGIQLKSSIASKCIIRNCFATGVTGAFGGGIFTSESKLSNSLITNCSTKSTGSTSSSCGGGITNFESDVINCTITNCTSSGPYRLYGSGVFNSRNKSLINCIIYNNAFNKTDFFNQLKDNDPDYKDVKTCAIHNQYIPGNIGLESDSSPDTLYSLPKFKNIPDSLGYVTTEEGLNNISNGDWRIEEGSVCIDAGTGSCLPILMYTDIAGNERIINDKIDIGPYEYRTKHIITANANTGGTVSPRDTTVRYGSNVTFTISCDTGYEIESVFYGLIDVTNLIEQIGNNYTFTIYNIVENGTLNISFKKKRYTLNGIASAGGSITPIVITVEHGSNLIFTITCEPGYMISTAYYGGIDITNNIVQTDSNYTYTVYNITEDGSLYVNFSSSGYILTAIAGTGGTVSPTNITVQSGSNQTFTITCDSGYLIDTVTYNGINVTNDIIESGNSYTYTVSNVTEDGTLYVTFGSYDFSVTATAGLGGNVTPTFSQVSSNSNLILTINCAASYQIETATYNGTDVLSEIVSLGENCYTYTATNITEDGSFHVTFIPKTFNVTATANSGGTVTPTSATVSYGSGQVFTIIPMDYGFGIKTALYNNVDVYSELEKSGTHYTYTKTNIQEDGEFEVTFGLIEYTLISTSNIGGAVTPDTVTVYHGTSHSFTITPDENFSVTEASYNDVNVMEDMVESNGGYTYTATDINEDGILHVTFSNSTSIAPNPNINFNIFPNPTDGLVNIHLPENISEFKLRIVDMNGKIVLIDNHFSSEKSLNISKLPSGIYQVIVEYDKQLLTKRLIKK